MESWTEQDFERLSWHDNHVHGFSVRDGDHGAGQLILDLDFIVKWLKAPPDALRFLVAPATLTFNEVTDLRISIDYAGAAMGSFSIAGIEREVKSYPNGFTTAHWRIPINWPKGELSFLATGFIQSLRCAPMETPNQNLTWAQRSRGAV